MRYFIPIAATLLASPWGDAAAGAADRVVHQQGRKFSVAEVTVARGEQIVFLNDDTVPHNIMSTSAENGFRSRFADSRNRNPHKFHYCRYGCRHMRDPSPHADDDQGHRQMTLQAKFSYASAFIAMLAISLAAFGVYAVDATSNLIVRLYDKPLMGVNYARAASATLTEARALAAQSRLLGPQSLAAISPPFQQMQRDIADDLRIVRERVDDADIVTALNHTEAAIAEWSGSERMILWPPTEGLTTLPMPSTADRQGAIAGVRLDDLVELIAAEGYAYRSRAKAEMRGSNATLIAMGGTIILLSAMVVAMFARLLIRPIGAATRLAEDVAAGSIATINVTTRRDEIGRLINPLPPCRPTCSVANCKPSPL